VTGRRRQRSGSLAALVRPRMSNTSGRCHETALSDPLAAPSVADKVPCGRKGCGVNRIPLEEARRAQTWNLVIPSIILGPNVPYRDEGHDRRWSGLGGFSVDLRDGAWWCFGAEIGGHGTVGMTRFLLSSSREDAAAWVSAFLAANPGTGPCTADVPEEDDAGETRAQISAYRAREIIAAAGSIDGTDGERYLRSRGLAPPYPIKLTWLPDARAGEGAIVVELTASNRPVAILCTYVDATCRKSAHSPNRRRFNLEPYRPDAVMLIAEREAGTVDIGADVIIVEGLENGLSVAQVKQPGWQIIALPGIGALQHLEVGS
jgi:hypothetical protein